MSNWIASVVQLAGFAAVTIGGFLVSPVVGWFIGGASLIVSGIALERS